MLDETAMPIPVDSPTYPDWRYVPTMDHGVITFADGRTVCIQGDDALQLEDALHRAYRLGFSKRLILEQFEDVAT